MVFLFRKQREKYAQESTAAVESLAGMKPNVQAGESLFFKEFWNKNEFLYSNGLVSTNELAKFVFLSSLNEHVSVSLAYP